MHLIAISYEKGKKDVKTMEEATFTTTWKQRFGYEYVEDGEIAVTKKNHTYCRILTTGEHKRYWGEYVSQRISVQPRVVKNSISQVNSSDGIPFIVDYSAVFSLNWDYFRPEVVTPRRISDLVLNQMSGYKSLVNAVVEDAIRVVFGQYLAIELCSGHYFGDRKEKVTREVKQQLRGQNVLCNAVRLSAVEPPSWFDTHQQQVRGRSELVTFLNSVSEEQASRMFKAEFLQSLQGLGGTMNVYTNFDDHDRPIPEQPIRNGRSHQNTFSTNSYYHQ